MVKAVTTRTAFEIIAENKRLTVALQQAQTKIYELEEKFGGTGLAKTKRNKLIYALWSSGTMLKEVAAKYDLSSTRVGQIVRRQHRANINATLGQTEDECRSCKAPIVWLRGIKKCCQPNRPDIPIDYDTFTHGDEYVFDIAKGHISHFYTCPNAD